MKGVGYRWGEAKAKLELRLARDKKNNRKGSYRQVNKKEEVKEGVHPATHKQCWETGSNGRGEGWCTYKFLLESSMAASLSTPLEWMDSRMGTVTVKSLSLKGKTKLVTT